jgi:UDP-N-acetylglucosamine/UDP-N-acetylgalactosamine diphosphorylase
MEPRTECCEKVKRLIDKGVEILNPLYTDVGDEVDVDRISGKGVRIWPGCRIYGKNTVISAGCRIGQEAPATLDDCRLGPEVELKGGYFARSVFLSRANMGSGAHVREGCLLEEEANGAHCVGIKQTILFPFVTLGSLINFCDCLMSGGTSRKDHSEVGSSYIHFNFTPEGDTTTASRIGDVPRGVMLNQPAIFLGGQGGIVGPIRMGFGNIVAADSVLRGDYIDDNKLIVGKTPSARTVPYVRRAYPGLKRIVENNIIYMANLAALEEWYEHVRRPFFEAMEFGPLVFEGATEMLSLAKKERIKRLEVLAEKVKAPSEKETETESAFRKAFHEKISAMKAVLSSAAGEKEAVELREHFLSLAGKSKGVGDAVYIEFVQGMPSEVSAAGTAWLQRIVDVSYEKCLEMLQT